MKSKRKNQLLLIGLLVVAVVLAAAYLVITHTKEKGSEIPKAPEFFEVMKLDVEQIDRIELSSEDTKLVFTKDAEVWSRENAEFFPVKQQMLVNLVSVILSNLNAFRRVSEPGALSEYGLAEPNAELTAYTKGEEAVRIQLGSKLPTEDHYYCKFAGDDSVYVVSPNYHDFLTRSENEYLADIGLPEIASADYLREIEVVSDEFGSFHAIYDANNCYDYSGGDLFSWYFTDPLKGRANADFDTNTWYSQLSAYTSIRYEELVMYRPADLSVYGLKEPHHTLTVHYTNATGNEDNAYVLYLGDKNENGSYYAKLEGSDWILLLSASSVEQKLKRNLTDWIYDKLFWPNASLLSSITITTPEEEHVLKITHSASGDVALDTAAWDGKDVTENVMELCQDFLVLKLSTLAKEEPSNSEPILTISVETAGEGLSDSCFELLPYDEASYCLRTNGVVDYVIDKRDVDTYLSLISKY